MKRFLFGLLLSTIGLSYSLFCFIWSVKEPWHYRGVDGILGSLLGNELLTPYVVFSLLMMLGIAICCVEAYKRK